MNSDRWQQVEAVLQAALDRPLAERAAFLDAACAGDAQLKTEAASLIEAHDAASDFLEKPAIAEDARVLACELPDENLGRVVGPYRIVERLGAGGMSEVYLAQDTRLGRLVALKILPSYFVADETRLNRFQREARAASALNHPNVLTIHEVGASADVHFIATEFIDGQTIRELIEAGSLAVEDVLDIAVQVASGLAAAHAAGIIHRDIKPENIMRRADGIVKILDFGIAKLTEQVPAEFSGEAVTLLKAQTETGVVMGTVGYMSPEQARGLVVDERTDIWSLGCVLYEMLARRAPFAGATRLDTLVAILEREPSPLVSETKGTTPQLERLQRIVEKSLRKESGERYRNINEMLADLRSAGQEETEVSRPGTPQPPSRSRVFVAVAAALLLTALAAVFIYNRVLTTRRAADTSGIGEAVASAGKLYREMSEAEQLAFVDAQEQRISAMMGDRPVKLNEEALRSIKSYVDRYAARTGSVSNEYGKEDLRVIYARAVPYVPLIARSFAARKVPLIIGIYLPMIESEYKTCFENSFGAKGLFQFLPQTARLYGVAPEEMCDVERMTPAAAHYIADRMAELGDDSQSMTLVLLSYNRGPEWVRDTLRQLRSSDNYERNFWTLFANRDKLDDTFRKENAGYVPAFFAAAIVGENPLTFELRIPALSTLKENAER